MRFRDYKIAVVAFLIFLGCAPGASLSQARRSKTVWSYDGGVFFATDGSLPNGVCFRVSGEMNAAEFFDHLKRVDDEHGTVFRRGPETVSQFPEAGRSARDVQDRAPKSQLDGMTNSGAGKLKLEIGIANTCNPIYTFYLPISIFHFPLSILHCLAALLFLIENLRPKTVH